MTESKKRKSPTFEFPPSASKRPRLTPSAAVSTSSAADESSACLVCAAPTQDMAVRIDKGPDSVKMQLCLACRVPVARPGDQETFGVCQACPPGSRQVEELFRINKTKIDLCWSCCRVPGKLLLYKCAKCYPAEPAQERPSVPESQIQAYECADCLSSICACCACCLDVTQAKRSAVYDGHGILTGYICTQCRSRLSIAEESTTYSCSGCRRMGVARKMFGITHQGNGWPIRFCRECAEEDTAATAPAPAEAKSSSKEEGKAALAALPRRKVYQATLKYQCALCKSKSADAKAVATVKNRDGADVVLCTACCQDADNEIKQGVFCVDCFPSSAWFDQYGTFVKFHKPCAVHADRSLARDVRLRGCCSECGQKDVKVKLWTDSFLTCAECIAAALIDMAKAS